MWAVCSKVCASDEYIIWSMLDWTRQTSQSRFMVEKDEIEGLRHEYSETLSDIRNYANLRFTIVAVYLAAMGGIGSIAFGLVLLKGEHAALFEEFGRCAGLGVTVLFFVYELRIQSLIERGLRNGKRIERLLRYRNLRRRRSWGRCRSSIRNIVFLG